MAAFVEKLQVDLLSLDDIVALHVMDVFPKYSLLFPVRAKIPKKSGAPVATPGLEIWAPPSASSWMRVGNGRMGFGRNCDPNGESICYLMGLARAPGFLNAAMVRPAAFLIVWKKTIDSRARRFSRIRFGA